MKLKMLWKLCNSVNVKAVQKVIDKTWINYKLNMGDCE